MNAFEEYLKFIKRYNPSHDFSKEERNFLRRDFEDLKQFIEALGSDEEANKVKVNFEDVLPEEIFYYQDNTYVKISDRKGRVHQGRNFQQFSPLTSVEVYRKNNR